VTPGETVTAVFNVQNTGELAGTYTVDVKVNDEVVKTISDSINGGKSGTATATFTAPDIQGSYTVGVNRVESTFTVEGSRSLTKKTLYRVGGLVGVGVFVIIIYYIIVKRREDEKWYREREELRKREQEEYRYKRRYT
jgi:hypothetical protein